MRPSAPTPDQRTLFEPQQRGVGTATAERGGAASKEGRRIWNPGNDDKKKTTKLGITVSNQRFRFFASSAPLPFNEMHYG